MIKGHVQIDLHNHKTGLKDRIEQDNMVTNAMQKIIDATVYENMSLPSYITPVTTSGLGGLFLFDNTLTENANNVYFPGNAKLVARAGQYTDTENAKRGSLNVLESGAIDDDTYMNVWDFSTSQANGVIKSLSLTSAWAGQNLFGYTTFLSVGPEYDTPWGRVMWYDEDEQYIYKSDYDGLVSRYKWYRTDFPIDRSFSNAFDPIETFVQLTLSGRIYASNYNTGCAWGCCLLNDFLYFETFHNGKWWLAKLDLENWTATCDLCELPQGTSDVPSSRLCTANGYIYATAYQSLYNGNIYGSYFVRKIDPSDYSYTDISVPSIGSIMAIGDVVYHSAGYIIYPDDSVVNMGTTFSIPQGVGWVPAPNGNPLDFMTFPGDYRLSYFFPLNYLGTICNLAQPVEKTTSVTMKVKYTITNAE